MTDKPVLLIDANMYRATDIQGTLAFPNARDLNNKRLLNFLEQAQEDYRIIFVADNTMLALKDLAPINSTLKNTIHSNIVISWGNLTTIEDAPNAPYIHFITTKLDEKKLEICAHHHLFNLDVKILEERNPYQHFLDQTKEVHDFFEDFNLNDEEIEQGYSDITVEESNALMQEMGYEPLSDEDMDIILQKTMTKFSLPSTLTKIFNTPEVSGLLELMPNDDALFGCPDTRQNVMSYIEAYVKIAMNAEKLEATYRSKLHLFLEMKAYITQDFNKYCNKDKANVIQNPALDNTTQLMPTNARKVVNPALRATNRIIHDYYEQRIKSMATPEA